MKKPYIKPPFTFEQQIEQLIARGLRVEDKKATILSLSSINYYRLSAYWYPFKERNSKGEVLDQFVESSGFNQVLSLYEFDRKLRLLMLDAIERVEVAIRAQITYHLSHQYGAFGYLNPKNFHP